MVGEEVVCAITKTFIFRLRMAFSGAVLRPQLGAKNRQGNSTCPEYATACQNEEGL